ncbi:MAG TPA: discoidin domain-containing protein, partial [Planctomycetota bacterium]|nr:discoidin domain-containing protein [Planctomycetota bacterium]
RTGTIEINVAGASTGLVLGEAGTLEIADGGRIVIDVSQPGDPSMQADGAAPHVGADPRPFRWAIQWRGDHLDYLTELVRTGRIAWPAASPLSVFLRDGCTYVALVGNPPRVTEFQLVDPTTGGCTVASGDAVRVRAAAVPGDSPIAAWAVTSDATPPADPARWTDRPASIVALDGPPGEFVRYAWVKDAAGAIAVRRARILFDPRRPAKKQMSASASSARAAAPAANAIDGDDGTAWSADGVGSSAPPGQWLRIDLGARRTVAAVTCGPPTGSPAFAGEFQIYVSDRPGPESGTVTASQAREYWGEPVATGRLDSASREPLRLVLAIPRPGRFIVLYAASAGPLAVAEIYLSLPPMVE